VPDEGEQPRLTADHPLSPRPSFADPYETAVYPIQGAFRAFGLERGTFANIAGVRGTLCGCGALPASFRMPGLYGQVIWACRAASFVPNAVQKDVSHVQTIVATCTGVPFVSGSLSDLHREGS
jgi:hypothetical protein